MISAWWLVVIIPVSSLIGALLMGLCCAARNGGQ